MFKTIIKLTTIILFSLVLCEFNLLVKAEGNSGKNFILPKTFKINDKFLPPLNAKSETPKKKTVSTVKNLVKVNKPTSVIVLTGNKPVKTFKPNSAVTSTQINNKIPAVYKQPASASILAKTSIKNNNIKSSIIQTNSVKINPTIKSNNAASLTSLIKNYKYPYADTLKSTITALSSMEITPESYNTERGQIIAKLPSGKEIFILLVPFNENSTCVRITPTDENYNLPMTSINEIFSNIKDNLSPNKNHSK